MPVELMMGALLMAGLDSDADKQYAIQLYHEYRGLFYKVSLRYFGQCEQDVEDAVSEAVVYICTYLQAVKQVPQNRLPAYMMAIIRHVCMHNLKKRNKEKSRMIRKDISELQDVLAADEDVEDVVFSRLNALTLLESFFCVLNTREQELIRMRHIDRLTFQEMAEVLDMKEGTVRTALSRAKQRLVNEASKRGEHE